jgi:surface protein
MLYLVPSETFFFVSLGGDNDYVTRDAALDDSDFLWMVADFLIQPLPTEREFEQEIVPCKHFLLLGPIPYWDLSNLLDTRWILLPKYFNGDVSRWDVSNVRIMGYLFAGCESFNQPLETWNVSNVVCMQNMFRECHSFNQPLEEWNVSNVKDMFSMFAGCKSFNQPLERWNTSNVQLMGVMFSGASSFNQPWYTWYLGKVHDVTHFEGCICNKPFYEEITF